MHMADALVSPAVGGVMLAASAGCIAYSAYKCKDTVDEKTVPLMGVMGAVVFAGQMLNFTIPGTGSSGHIGGGILLAAMLGPFPAFLVITAVLLMQCLFFADGGLLALGCNVWNMGFYACLLIYPLVYRPMVKKGLTPGRITAASIVSVVLALSLGAFSVVLETTASGVTALPFATFCGLMLPIHLAIGLVEGIVTAGVLNFVYKMRPEILDAAATGQGLSKTLPLKKVLASMVVFALVMAGGLSLLASQNPDGLEWAMENLTGSTELEAEGALHGEAAALQESTAILPDYNVDGGDSAAGTSAAGLIGAAITLVVAGGAGLVITKVKKGKNKVA